MNLKISNKVKAFLAFRDAKKRGSTAGANPKDVGKPEQRDPSPSAGGENIPNMDPENVRKAKQPGSSADAGDKPYIDSADVKPTERRNPVSSAGADNIPHLLDPKAVRGHFDRIRRFRVLVLGKANAGKTTLLQRVCNTTELPEVFNGKGEKLDLTTVQGSLQRGYHDIENELIFASNPRFIFHDSRGFEAGSVSEIELMKKFIADRATRKRLADRVHAIWFCIPMTEPERAIVAAEVQFFNQCNTGRMPVIVVLTKADAMEGLAIGELVEAGMEMREAMQKAGTEATKILTKVRTKIENKLNGCKYPPKNYLPLSGMNTEGADCDALIKCTTNSLDEVELQKLVVSAQQVNFELNIEFSLKYVMGQAKGETFNKKFLELEILQWMPLKQFEEVVHKPQEQQQDILKHLKELHELDDDQELLNDLVEFIELRQEHLEEIELPLRLKQQEKRLELLLKDLDLIRKQVQTQDKPLNQTYYLGVSADFPLMFPPSIVSSKYQWIIQGVGIIIVFEYCYFCLQGTESVENVIAVGLKEYKDSGTEAIVFQGLLKVLQENGDDDKVQELILDLIMRNRMSKRFT